MADARCGPFGVVAAAFLGGGQPSRFRPAAERYRKWYRSAASSVDMPKRVSHRALPNIVTLDNMRYTRYTRNPGIARVLAGMGWVRELNEDVGRIYDEIQAFFLRDPSYSESNDAAVLLTLENNIATRVVRRQGADPQGGTRAGRRGPHRLRARGSAIRLLQRQGEGRRPRRGVRPQRQVREEGPEGPRGKAAPGVARVEFERPVPVLSPFVTASGLFRAGRGCSELVGVGRSCSELLGLSRRP